MDAWVINRILQMEKMHLVAFDLNNLIRAILWNVDRAGIIQQRLLDNVLHMSRVMRKPTFWFCDLVRHKLGCKTKEDGLRLEISDLESRGIVLSM